MFRRIFSLIKKEFWAIWKDPKSRALIFLPPILQLIIFAQAATMEVRNIDMAVLDRSNTIQSRNLIEEFRHSRWFKNVYIVQSENEVTQAIRTRRAQVALTIQTDFATKLKKNQPTSVQIILDGRQTNAAGITNGYAASIISQYEQEYFPKRFKSIPRITPEVRNWYNPNIFYLWYTVVSLIAILATTISLILTSLSIARERELGTFDQLIVSPLTSFEILVGKTVPPMVIALAIVSVMSLFIIIFYKVPFQGSVGLFYLSLFVYLLSMVGIGLFISSICRTQQQAMLGAFTFQMPAILLSGYISPVEDMPVIFQVISWLDPVRFFLVIIKGIYLKAMPASYVFENLIPLALIAVFTLAAAGWMFKRNLD